MTGYLDQVIAQALGGEPEIKPRLRARFEPAYASDAGSISESEEFDSLPDRHAMRLPPVYRDASAADDPDLPHPTPHTQAAPDRDAFEQVAETKPRIERIDHHVVEQSPAGPVIAAPAREKTIAIERVREIVTPVVRLPLSTAARPVDPARHTDLPQPLVAAAENVALPDSTEAPIETVGITPANISPLRLTAEVASPRTDPMEMPALQQAPEITITIGVLDIRLTQEAPTERRASARPGVRPDSHLPLADYLAKRSGNAS